MRARHASRSCLGYRCTRPVLSLSVDVGVLPAWESAKCAEGWPHLGRPRQAPGNRYWRAVLVHPFRSTENPRWGRQDGTGGRGCRRSRPAATRSPAGGDCCLLPNRLAACRPGNARQPRQRKPVHGHDHRCARGRDGHENEPRSDRPDMARVRSVNPMSATSAATTLRHDAHSARPEVVAHRRAGRVRGRSAAGRVAPTRDGRRSRCHTKAHTTPASPKRIPKGRGVPCRAGLGCRRS